MKHQHSRQKPRLLADVSCGSSSEHRLQTRRRKTRGTPPENLRDPIWGISTVGSARHSHCRGQGFDSPMLHKEISHPSRVADFFMRTRGVRIPGFDTALNALERESRRRPPVEGVSSAAFSPETSDLRSAESRRLRARIRGSTQPAGGGNFVGGSLNRKGAVSTVWSCDHWGCGQGFDSPLLACRPGVRLPLSAATMDSTLLFSA